MRQAFCRIKTAAKGRCRPLAYNVLVKTISGGIQQFRASDAVDIAIITVLIYHLILLTKETRAFQVLKGIGIVFIAALVSDVLQLVTIILSRIHI